MTEIRAKVYPAEYTDWIKMIYLMNWKNRPEVFVGMIGFLLISVTCFVVSFLIWFVYAGSFQIFYLVVIAFVLLCIFLDWDRRIRKSAKIMLGDNALQTFPKHFVIKSTGFFEAGKHENNYSKWTDFKRRIISKNYILLFHDEEMIYFMSSNYSEEDFETIKKWALEKINE